jgi:predicted amidohydrolase
MPDQLTVAVAQVNAIFGDAKANSQRAVEVVARAADAGARLVVLPECFLTGYVTSCREQAFAIAINSDGPEMGDLARACREREMHALVGYLERDGDQLFNTVAVLGPGGLIGRYRKRHLPFMGADRFVTVSEETAPAVFDTALGRIGIAICYEIRFPEVMRTLALAGAELIALPTNWPVQASILADHFTRVRAAENFVYLLVSNRGDAEHGIDFLGDSQIVDPMGEVLAKAENEQDLLVVDVDLARSRDKSITFTAGEFELNPWKDRRPAAYRI